MKKERVSQAASRSDKTFSDSTSPELGLKKSSKAAESIEFELFFPAKPDFTSAIFIFCSLKKSRFGNFEKQINTRKVFFLDFLKVVLFFIEKEGLNFVFFS